MIVSNDVTIRIRCKYDGGLRIDKLLAEKWSISRSKVSKMAKADKLMLNPNITMKDKVIDNLQITVRREWHQEVASSLYSELL